MTFGSRCEGHVALECGEEEVAVIEFAGSRHL